MPRNKDPQQKDDNENKDSDNNMNLDCASSTKMAICGAPSNQKVKTSTFTTLNCSTISPKQKIKVTFIRGTTTCRYVVVYTYAIGGTQKAQGEKMKTREIVNQEHSTIRQEISNNNHNYHFNYEARKTFPKE
jgi:hypothetical protein